MARNVCVLFIVLLIVYVNSQAVKNVKILF
jgi:hypothetical protein